MFSMQKALMLLSVLTITACDQETPAEVRTDASAFAVTENWAANAAPVSPATVSGTIAIKQYDGYHLVATLSINGASSAAYQWRIFRGDCATTTVAASNVAPTGLLRFATVESYPDVTTDATGKGTIVRTIAGSLDSLKSYSVRVRVSQSATGWNGTSPIACGNLQRSPGG